MICFLADEQVEIIIMTNTMNVDGLDSERDIKQFNFDDGAGPTENISF